MPHELLVGHIHQKHPSIDLRTVDIIKDRNKYNPVKCPLCDNRMPYKILYAHIVSKHPEQKAKLVMAEFNRKYPKQHREKEKMERELDILVSEYERLKQAYDEPRDAGKYMGFMKRENGKFGSLPLHDNYSDESDAK